MAAVNEKITIVLTGYATSSGKELCVEETSDYILHLIYISLAAKNKLIC